MGEALILTSINGRLLTEKSVDSWLEANGMYITNKVFSEDRCSVEITFIDEERADMMADLLTTCYSGCISISRPQSLAPFLDNSFDEERIPSPVHLSSSASVSSFSQRLARPDKKRQDEQIKLAVGRGRGMDVDSSRIEKLIARGETNGIDDDAVTITNSTVSSMFGRGRGTQFK